jgi:hypothetical protein
VEFISVESKKVLEICDFFQLSAKRSQLMLLSVSQIHAFIQVVFNNTSIEKEPLETVLLHGKTSGGDYF